jgi:nucleotide-binding universal stress UspA family protein
MTASQIKRILIPTDLSDFAGVAIRYGALFHRQLGATLTLLYADEIMIPFGPEFPMGYYMDNPPEVRQNEMKMLQEQAEKFAPGADVETVVLSDVPSRAIVTTADRMKADMIIMGTHGRHGFERVFLGSVAERVLRVRR